MAKYSVGDVVYIGNNTVSSEITDVYSGLYLLKTWSVEHDRYLTFQTTDEDLLNEKTIYQRLAELERGKDA